MNHWWPLLFLLQNLNSPPAPVPPRSAVFAPQWTQAGPRLQWKKGIFDLRFKARALHDSAWREVDDGPRNRSFSDSDFRRLRPAVIASIGPHLGVRVEWEIDDNAKPTDVYLELKNVASLNRLRLGRSKEPLNLEQATSSSNTVFIERSSLSAFTSGRNTGILWIDSLASRRASWSAGAYFDDNAPANQPQSGEWSFVGRLWARPWTNSEGTNLLHLGLTASRRRPPGGTVRFRARPDTSFGERLVDTGAFKAKNYSIFAPEVALLLGSFSLQGEATAVRIPGHDNRLLWGAYSRASFILTGEKRRYQPELGRFRGVIPRRNLTASNGGFGAVEVALRISRLDLSDEEIQGGRLDTFTLGLNWYLSPYARIMLNRTRGFSSPQASEIWALRLQFNF